jgi:hypothetical protein
MAEGGLVRFENVDGIGVVTIDNPPVSALSPGVPEGIVENIERGNAHPLIRAIVLIGAGRSFIAGADIRTFGTNRPPSVPGRRPHQILDASQKPIVAAIHGYALGGGLELALASHYRIRSRRPSDGVSVRRAVSPSARRIFTVLSISAAAEAHLCHEGPAATEGAQMVVWTETCRGTVPPWECDVTEHFTIAYYCDRIDAASCRGGRPSLYWGRP